MSMEDCTAMQLPLDDADLGSDSLSVKCGDASHETTALGYATKAYALLRLTLFSTRRSATIVAKVPFMGSPNIGRKGINAGCLHDVADFVGGIRK
jgi:hypothetical protein